MIRKMEKGLQWLPFVYGIGVVLELMLALLGKGSGLGEPSNVFVMLAFFLTVAVIFFLSYRCLGTGRKMRECLEKAGVEIQSLSMVAGGDVLKEMQSREKFFGESRLDAAFSEFNEDVERIALAGETHKIKIGTKGNIEDYINEELMESAIQNNFLNQVPATLTGLGILGTFLGLSIGLNSFELSGTAAEVEGKIGPLMDGIKVAFHTSICGLCFSILFNFFYRKTLAEIMGALDDFLNIFQGYAVPSTENGSANTFLKYQAMVCKALQEQTYIENAIMERQDARFAGLAEKMDEQNKQTLRMYRQVNERICESQMEGMEKIVNAFIGQMHAALQGSFKDTETMIRNLQLYQAKSQSSLEAVLRQICGMSADLSAVNAGLGHTVQDLRQFMEDTSNIQEMLRDNLAAVRGQSETERKRLQEQSELIHRLAAQEVRLAAMAAEAENRMSKVCEWQEERLEKVNEQQEERLTRVKEEQEKRLTEMALEQEERLAAAGRAQEERMARADAAQAERLSGIYVQQEERLAEAAQGQEERLAKAAQGQEERLAKAAQDQEERLAKVAQGQEERLAKAAQGQEERLAREAQGQEERLTKTAEEQEGRLARLAAGQEERWGEIVRTQETRTVQWAEAQEARLAAAVTAQEQRVGNAVSEQGKRLEAAADGLGRKIGHMAEVQTQQIISSFAAQEKQMNLALDSFAQGMQERIHAMRQMQESFDAALRQGMTAIHAMAEETCRELKEQAGQGMEAVNGAVYDKIGEISGTVENMSRHMEENIKSMDKIIRNLYEESDRRQAAARQVKTESRAIGQETEGEGEKLEEDKEIP